MTAPQPNPAGDADKPADDTDDVPTANPAYSTPPPEGISEADDK